MSTTTATKPPRIAASSSSSVGLFGLLLALRVANALLISTFFQPDEYYQSLEPAWQLAFGDQSRAWITWEWRHQLRTSLHPLLFGSIYRAVSFLPASSIASRSQILLAGPKVAQAFFATCTDFFTWKCAQRVYGIESRSAWTTLILSLVSPWQFFCSVRTFSNSIETSLTALALSLWPWNLISLSNRNNVRTPKYEDSLNKSVSISELRLSLLLAALATILRPTNILIWIPLALIALYNSPTHVRVILAREALLCGSIILAISAISDRWYYGFWTFPLFRFLYFNVAQDLAVFYGRNRWDYYLTEGLPLLLTTSLPFAGLGIFQSVARNKITASTTNHVDETATILSVLKWTVGFVVTSLSLIAHKEVRFLYPLLPALQIIAAYPAAQFTKSRKTLKRLGVLLLLLANVVITIYLTQVHQRGVVDVTHYLREQHESRLQSHGPKVVTSVAFLMPCHSTPWRSHLIHQQIEAWALTCEPPIDVPFSHREQYLDEADQFYEDPEAWMRDNMKNSKTMSKSIDIFGHKSPRPEYLVFFEHLEPNIKNVWAKEGYQECWRTFNTHWHDDSRRKGDVIVWCRV
ncbi:hypothetical protein BT63DRAFT_410684 [Microthyrium microscopicum]|uniref:Mannosyltransferase n=1 Tax=Microthyrium microscopicum TaxID=703497 RepID=A0A6A6UQP9_9PEZI|nr:hypothetical protein BT63DRAFT_410684 [Microthyrium microscopicum]